MLIGYSVSSIPAHGRIRKYLDSDFVFDMVLLIETYGTNCDSLLASCIIFKYN